MRIEYFTKSVYGVNRYYVKDEEQAKILFALTGTKTLLPEHKDALEKLEVEFEEVIPPKI